MSDVIGEDYDGVSEVSYKSLRRLLDEGKSLKKITFSDDLLMVTTFFFEDDTSYRATGFSIGYGGTGPHCLHKIIYEFCPDSIPSDFWTSGINSLDHSGRHKYAWTPEDGFKQTKE